MFLIVDKMLPFNINIISFCTENEVNLLQIFNHMKKLLLSLFFLPFLVLSQAPPGYYDAANGLTGYTLKSKLHEIISANNYNWNYDSDLIDFYKIIDIDKYYENDGSYLDIYTEKPGDIEKSFFPTDANAFIGSAKTEGEGLNKEHIIPQNVYYSNYPMVSDLFNVIPADARINQLRNFYPYGISKATVSNVYYNFTNGSKIGNNADTSEYTGRVYEPVEAFRGEIARSVLYFVVRYEGKLSSFRYFYNSLVGTVTVANDVSTLNGTEEQALDPWYLKQMLKWNRDYPVSQKEIDRNNAVYSIQKNRNPFIDHPEWADLIWNQTPDTVLPNAPTNLSLVKKGAQFLTVTWQTSNSSDVIGYKIYKDGVLAGYTKGNTFTLDKLAPSTTYNITVKAYDNAYLYSTDSNLLQETTLATDSYAKDLMITKYLEGTTNSNDKIFNNAIEITNKTGYDVNLSNYTLSIQNYSAATSGYYFSDAYQFEGVVKDGETFVVINPEASFSCYNVSQAKFVTASPAMMYYGAQYLELSYNGTAVDVVGFKDTSNTNGNKSLYRKSDINQPTNAFNTAEWDEYAMNYCANLGVLANDEIKVTDHKIIIYPNPVTKGQLFADGKDISKVSTAKIFDISGKLMSTENNPFRSKNYIDVSSLQMGMYILVLDNQSFKFIKN